MRTWLRYIVLFILLYLVSGCTTGAVEPIVQVTPTSTPTFFPIEDTGLQHCYNYIGIVPCTEEGGVLYGQDANYLGHTFQFIDNNNGTVSDMVSGLTWQQVQSSERLNQVDAEQTCLNLNLGGKDDWRLPTIQELFSIADVSGIPGELFFLDSDIFDIRYGDPSSIYVDGLSFDLAGQTWSATLDDTGTAAYTYNFFIGDLRSYTTDQQFFFRCVSGDSYGHNALHDNGDGTVADGASGLTWQQEESAYALNWGGALNYCDTLNLAGYNDWRLPDIKELASIAFALEDTALFPTSSEYARLWSSTTRVDVPTEAYYLCVDNCWTRDGSTDLGSASLRSEPKNGDPQAYSDSTVEVRITNLVRCVRGGEVIQANGPYLAEETTIELVPDLAAAAQELGIAPTALNSVLNSSNSTDPLIQKAAFALGVEVEDLRSALQAHMVQPTQAPST